MNTYRFQLEKYNGMKTRFTCPQCKRKKIFVKYIDNKTGSYISDKVGRCNRESECGYHYKPKEYFENNIMEIKREHYIPTIAPPKTIDYMNKNDVYKSMSYFDHNNLIQFLYTQFKKDIVDAVVKKYAIGTVGNWTVFWQIDIDKNVRTGKKMLYVKETGKRYKEDHKFSIAWMHKKGFNLKQCFFGEHLLNIESDKPIAIVESEKTAIISSIKYPEFIWLASSGKQGLNKEKCKVLGFNNVTLFPDNDAYDDWKKIAKNFGFEIFDGLKGLNDVSGYDLADFILEPT